MCAFIRVLITQPHATACAKPGRAAHGLAVTSRRAAGDEDEPPANKVLRTKTTPLPRQGAPEELGGRGMPRGSDMSWPRNAARQRLVAVCVQVFAAMFLAPVASAQQVAPGRAPPLQAGDVFIGQFERGGSSVDGLFELRVHSPVTGQASWMSEALGPHPGVFSLRHVYGVQTLAVPAPEGRADARCFRLDDQLPRQQRQRGPRLRGCGAGEARLRAAELHGPR